VYHVTKHDLLNGFDMQASNHAQLKVARSRERMRAAGLRPVQFWVPDTRLPSFVAEVQSQCLALKGDKQESEVIAFSQQAATQIEGWV